jgi:stage V sporulation protein R
MKTLKSLSTASEWTLELLEQYDREIARVAKNYGLDTYPNQIEIITTEQMLDAYSSVGMPINYHHWSFGKQFVLNERSYKHGQMGLAYEIVINSNPCIAYLIEENTLTMQALVIAHACYGHNSFFKNNYLFKSWTDAESIIDYLIFARNYLAMCEEKYGVDEVEKLLDAAHALMNYGVDRYKHPAKLSVQEEKIRQQNREVYIQSQINDLWRTLPKSDHAAASHGPARFPAEPQENILYFLEKNAPLLEPWQREVIRIVRKISQYFYPQRQTQVMNEGWACFWHYTLLNTLYDEGQLSDAFMLEFLQYHTSVIYQPPYNSNHFVGINPYTLGFNMMMDIRRICENPTEEDKKWFPDLANTPWLTSLDFAMRNFKDESFIAQYLSPKLMRDLKLFSIKDDQRDPELHVTAIHDEAGYQHLREVLSAQYNLSINDPNIQVYQVNTEGDRAMTLHHIRHQNRPLNADTEQVLRYLHQLWKFPVRIESYDSNGELIQTLSFPKA